MAILEGDDLAKVLDHAGSHRRLFEMLAYTGLRIGELLGLVWADVELDDGILHLDRRLSRPCHATRLSAWNSGRCPWRRRPAI